MDVPARRAMKAAMGDPEGLRIGFLGTAVFGGIIVQEHTMDFDQDGSPLHKIAMSTPLRGAPKPSPATDPNLLDDIVANYNSEYADTYGASSSNTSRRFTRNC